MIEIDYTESLQVLCLRVRGHAGAGKYGEDIVCAAVSSLIYTLAQEIEKAEEKGQLEKNSKIILKSGFAGVTSKPKAKYYETIRHAYMLIFSGLELISKSYPEYFKRVCRDSSTNGQTESST